eukprot:745977_1
MRPINTFVPGREGVVLSNWDDNLVTEVGTMNLFFLWKRKDGTKELITAPLDGTILPGVTRRSVLELCRQWGEFDVTEKEYSLHEVTDAISEGRVLECFGTGTACVISPVKGFFFNEKEYDIPLDPEKPNEEAGPLAKRLWDDLTGIQYGSISHPWSEAIE